MVDDIDNCYLRLKLFNGTNEKLTCNIQDEPIEVQANSRTIKDLTVTAAQHMLVINSIPTGIQANIVIYENGYPASV